MTQLYQLTENFRELQELADGADEDLAVAVRDTLESVAGEFEDKGKAIAMVALNMDGDIEAIDSQIARLQERKRTITNRQNSLKEYLRENMEATGITKISHPLFTITCAKGREIAVIDDEKVLDDDFVRVKTSIEPDKPAILKALKEGVEVKGAHIELGKSSIRIK